MSEKSANKITIKITAGNLRNSYMSIAEYQRFFPKIAFGGSDCENPGKELTLFVEGLDYLIVTDIVGNKSVFRKRGWCRTFYQLHRIKAGDRVTIMKLDEYNYKVFPTEQSIKTPSDIKNSSKLAMSTLTLNTSSKTKNQPQESSGNSNVEITNTLKKKKIIAFEESVDWQVRKDLVLEKFPVVVKKKNDKHTLTVTVTYAPLDWINEKAQIVIVGITPGKVQARNAYRKAKDKLLEGLNLDQSLKEAKYEGSFSGGMRDRLVRALDLVGINSLFKISTSDELFKITCSLAHFTSLLPYPVFVGTSGYDGKFPISPTSTLFNKFHNYFLDEIPLVQDALFLPLGEVAHKRLKDLSNEGALDDRQVLPWLLHPSDQNINRYKYLLGETSAEKATGDTNTAKIDKIKTDLEEKVKQLKTVKSWHELPKNESPK